MNISINDLDRGYTQISDFNTYVNNEGVRLFQKMESNISSLRVNWIGSDATVQINNLIQVHDALVALVTDAKKVTSYAGERIIAMQNVRRANGSAGSVGSELDSAEPSHQTISQVPETAQFDVKPGAVNDLATLTEICGEFEKFSSTFTEKKNELFSNWTDGADIATAKQCFQTFEENASTYATYLNKAKENLEIAVSNIQKLG